MPGMGMCTFAVDLLTTGQTPYLAFLFCILCIAGIIYLFLVTYTCEDLTISESTYFFIG